MWKRFFIGLAAMVLVFSCVAVNAYAADATTRFYRIAGCVNGLELESGGRMACTGQTLVYDGYKAGIVVELQQLSGGTWTTIKSWSHTEWDFAGIYGHHYVARGSYRLKLTHTALDGSNNVVDTFTDYSITVTY